MTKSKTPSASPAGAHTTEPQTREVVGAGTLSTEKAETGKLKAEISDSEIGQQLTAQYHRATGGMTEVLRFGGMMMQLREELSTRGKLSKGGPSKDGSGGITGWLEEHAPEVKRSTAERFLHVAEAVAADFTLPAKVSFIELATSSAESLSEPLRAKQSELWDFVNGTSQRSWLDRFAPSKPKGGYRPTKKNGAPRAEKRTDAEIARDEYEEHAPAVCRRTAETMVELLLLEGPDKERAWDILDDEELDKLKLQAHDLYEGALASQKRRKALRK
jgi:hypothetical protein